MEQQARTWEESPNIAKRRRKQGVNRSYTVGFDAIFIITRFRINPCLYSGFSWARCSPWDIEQWVGPSAFGLHLTDDVNSLDRRRHTSMDKKFAIKSLYFSFQSTVSVIIFYSTLYMYVLDKRNTLWLRDTVRQTSQMSVCIKSLYFSFQSTVSVIIFYSTLYMYVLDKRNTLWLRDTVRQTSQMSVWPYHVITKYSYCIRFYMSHVQYHQAPETVTCVW